MILLLDVPLHPDLLQHCRYDLEQRKKSLGTA